MSRELPKYSERLLAELMFDLKGRKTKSHDWMTIADMSETVVKHFDNSVSQAVKKLRIHPSTLNSILRLRDLDPRTQKLVRKRLVLFDSAQRLNTIRDGDRQYDVARLLIGLSNKQQRDLIQHALRYPELDLVDFRKKLTGEKTRRENIRVVILPMDDETYRSVEKVSKEERKPIQSLLMAIVSEWLERREKTH